MNIAFPTLLIFLLILPGFIFNSNYYYLENTPIDYKPFAQRTIRCIFISILFHLFFISLIYWFSSYRIDFSVILALLLGSGDEKLAIENILKNIELIILYWLILYSTAWFSGLVARKIIVKFKIDKYIKFMRLDNKWFYLFSGYDLGINSDLIAYVGFIIELGGIPYLYSGLLEEFFLDENGNLDRLVLYGAQRRKIDKDENQQSENKERFYEISGNYFVVQYSEIKNLNIKFYEIKPLEEKNRSSEVLNKETELQPT